MDCQEKILIFLNFKLRIEKLQNDPVSRKVAKILHKDSKLQKLQKWYGKTIEAAFYLHRCCFTYIMYIGSIALRSKSKDL